MKDQFVKYIEDKDMDSILNLLNCENSYELLEAFFEVKGISMTCEIVEE